MTRPIINSLATYLAKGASILEINTMVAMIEEYKSRVQGSIDDCYGLIPAKGGNDNTSWGDFKSIVSWLLSQGYSLSLPKTFKGGDVYWWLTKGDKFGKLYWGHITESFFVTDMDCPRDSEGNRLQHPTCLTWY